jgi:hypothetical protein
MTTPAVIDCPSPEAKVMSHAASSRRRFRKRHLRRHHVTGTASAGQPRDHGMSSYGGIADRQLSGRQMAIADIGGSLPFPKKDGILGMAGSVPFASVSND